METAAVIGFIAAIFLAMWIWGKIKQKGIEALNKNVIQRGTHREGMAIVSAPIKVTVRAEQHALFHALLNGIGLDQAPPAVMSKPYLASALPDGLEINYGSRINPEQFRSVVMLDGHEGGSSAVFAVTNWTTSDGVITGVSSMRAIRQRVIDIARTLDPAAVVIEGHAETA